MGNNLPLHLRRYLLSIGFQTEASGNGFAVVALAFNDSRKWYPIPGDFGSTPDEAIERTASHIGDFVS